MKRGGISKEAWDQAKTRRERGIVSAILHAEHEAEGWADRAFAHLCSYAAVHDKPFTIEEFRIWANAQGLAPPPDARAFGGVTQRALRRGVIKVSGYSPTVSSNGSRRALYSRPIGQWLKT